MNLPRSRGFSLVELALILPIFAMMVSYFWDTMAELIAQQRMESAAVQLLNYYVEPPLKLKNALVAGTARLVTLDSTPATGTTESDAYLNNIITELHNILSNSGSGAAQSTIGFLAELHYLDIFNTGDTAPTAGSSTPGYGRLATKKSSNLYTGTVGTPACFTEGARTDFASFRDSRNSLITGAEPPDYPSIGTRLFRTYWRDDFTEEYSLYEPFNIKFAIVYVMMCVRPPRLYFNDPVIKTFVILPPKEAGFP